MDAITLGDHVWDQKNFENEIDDLDLFADPPICPIQIPRRSSDLKTNGSKVESLRHWDAHSWTQG